MRLLLIAFSTFIFLTGCMARPIVTKTESPEHLMQNAVIKRNILETAKTRDWIVTRGYHYTDNLVASATGIPISHVAIIDSESLQVIEAEGKGIHLTGLDEFINKSFRVLVIRPRWRTEANAKQAWKAAEDLVGHSYDFLGTIGFDFPQKYYCSELAVKIYDKWYSGKEKFPGVIKPGELYLYGKVLYDSLPRDEI